MKEEERKPVILEEIFICQTSCNKMPYYPINRVFNKFPQQHMRNGGASHKSLDEITRKKMKTAESDVYEIEHPINKN